MKNTKTNVGSFTTVKLQAKMRSILAIILITVIGFAFTACSGSGTDKPQVSIPQLTGTVSISGTAEVGQTLTANTSSLGGSGTISYQWKRGTINIDTNSNTYVLVGADAGSAITVTVRRVGYSGSVTSDPTAIVPFPALTGTLTITGNTWVGQLLTANTGGLNGKGVYSYVWKRGDTADTVDTVITGVNQQSYTLTQADVGKYITVSVNTSNNPGNITSAAVGPTTAMSQEISVPGQDLAAKLEWLKTNAQSNAVYLVTVDKDESLPGDNNTSNLLSINSFSYSGKSNIIIKLEGDRNKRTVRLSSSGSLFTIESGVTLILDNNITLQGKNFGSNTTSLVFVNSGGVLEMKSGAQISDNYCDKTTVKYSYGGGVYVNGGTFTMSGGIISSNTSSARDSYNGTTRSYGGGVYVKNGNFTMSGGEISGNTARAVGSSGSNFSYGGGVYVSEGTFIMDGGIISGNTSVSDVDSGGTVYSSGGGVYVENGNFTMSGGKISDNTTSSRTPSFGSSWGGKAQSYGGGVSFMSDRTFIMSGGEISGNTSSATRSATFDDIYSYGGGVCVSRETIFNKTGGTIYGYTADDSKSNKIAIYYSQYASESVLNDKGRGHAVYVDFNWPNPGKHRESTAGPDVNMDSSVAGAAGGWEE